MYAPQILKKLGLTSIVALTVVTLGACGSSGSDGSSDAADSTTTEASSASTSAFAEKVDAACASLTTEIEASNKASQEAPDTEVQGLEQQAMEKAVDQFTSLTTTATDAGATTKDEKDFVVVIAKVPAAYTALATASEPLVTDENLAADPTKAAALEKAIEGPTNTLLDELQKGEDLAKKAGLTECTAMFEAIGPT